MIILFAVTETSMARPASVDCRSICSAIRQKMLVVSGNRFITGHFDEELVIPIIENEREDYLLVDRMREALEVNLDLEVLVDFSLSLFSLGVLGGS